MEYILQNWQDLNLIDRAWFIGGAWLLLLFIAMMGYKIFRGCCKKSH